VGEEIQTIIYQMKMYAMCERKVEVDKMHLKGGREGEDRLRRKRLFDTENVKKRWPIKISARDSI